MDGFHIFLRVDSPLLQGGPVRGQAEQYAQLRGPALRGLLHTFVRALIGPLLDQDAKRTRDAQRLLLGAAGGLELPGKRESGPTFRLATSLDGLSAGGSFLILPHRNDGPSRDGFVQTKDHEPSIWIRPRP